MEQLLSHIETDWKSRANDNGSEILKQYAERGRTLNIAYTCEGLKSWSINPVVYCNSLNFWTSHTIGYMYTAGFAVFSLLKPMTPIVLDLIKPLNETRPRFFSLNAEYFIDQNDHVTLVLIYNAIVNFLSMSICSGVDTIYSLQLHYACGILAELSWV